MIRALLIVMLAQAPEPVIAPWNPPPRTLADAGGDIAAAAAADAGEPVPVLTLTSLYAACPDAPFAEAVDGGYFVPEQRARRQTCQLAACEDFAGSKLAQASGEPMSTGMFLGIAGTGVGLILVGMAIGFFLPHPK